MTPPTLSRAPLLVLALLTMVWGAWLGAARLGWGLPLPAADHVLWHGPLLIGGFFGTLISFERAVGMRTRWAYAGPLLAAAGAVLLATGWSGVAAWAITSASAVLLAGGVINLARRRSLPAVAGATGAAAWLGGNVLWLAAAAVYQVVYWWTAFLVLTIAGTRLARSPLTLTLARRAMFVAGTLLLVGGILASASGPDLGVRVAGAGLLVIAAVLARQDVTAWRNARQQGFDRYMALAVIAGYGWLAAGGLMASLFGGVTIGPRYDAALHAVLLGFVMSMVFAHAPLMFPAILGVALPYRPAFYAHLALLHLSLAIRITGDLVAGLDPLRAWGGLLNAVALLLFPLNMVRSVVLARREVSW